MGHGHADSCASCNPTGRKTYVFESRLDGATVRINIGTLADWPIAKARAKAQGLKMLVDNGTDPREVEPGVNKRRDALEIDQLPAWFAGTEKLRRRTAAA